MTDPFKHTKGNRSAKVLVVGETWGTGSSPFSGQAGLEFSRILHDSGVLETEILYTSVVQAPGDLKQHLFTTKEKNLGVKFKGLNVKPYLIDGVNALKTLITTLKPILIIAAGPLSFYALSEASNENTFEGTKYPGGLTKYRGSQLFTDEINGNVYPLLPIYSPQQILKSWDLRFITVHDLKARARSYLSKPDLNYWKPPIYDSNYEPTYQGAIIQLFSWLSICDERELYLSVDIETFRQREIACIGFADDTRELCIPFFYFDTNAKVIHWFTLEQEIEIVKLIQKLLTHPNIRIIGQNYNYDYQYLSRYWSIKTPVFWDTMVAHHLMWPGTPKGLDYLSSLYCTHHLYWKDESQEWQDGVNHRDLWNYNCKDVRKTYEIAIFQMDLIPKLNLSQQYQWQMEQWQLATQMSDRGVSFDTSSRAKINQELQEAATEIETYLLESMPKDIRHTSTGGYWFNSPTQTANIFYNLLGIQPVLHKKTKRPTVDATSFETLKKRAPWLRPVIERLEILRSIQVFRSHFLDAKLSFDKRIRCSFNIGGTDTFRWSSNSNSFDEGTNLQNIPKGDA